MPHHAGLFLSTTGESLPVAQAEQVADEGSTGESDEGIVLNGLAQIIAQRLRLGDSEVTGAFRDQAGGFLHSADFQFQRLDLLADRRFRRRNAGLLRNAFDTLNDAGRALTGAFFVSHEHIS